MKQEDKELLLKDLSARIPHKVVAQVTYKDSEGWKTGDRKVLGAYTDGQIYVDCVYTNIENVKPYLRPMSSMTEEEREELAHYDNSVQRTDFFYSHHIDCRYMIEKSLVLEAPEGMY